MKKIIAILLMVMVFSMAVTGFAEEIVLGDVKITNDFAKKSEKSEVQNENTTQIDMVQISGNQYAILTCDFVGISYTAPNNYVYVLTQDYLHQAELFDDFYKNGMDMANVFIENGIHLNIYDAETGIDIYVKSGESDLATYFPDTDDMTEEEIQLVQNYFLTASFTAEDDPAFKRVGNNMYFFFDCSDTEETVYMYTFEGGQLICIWYNASTPEQVIKGIEVLGNLSISGLQFVQG